MANSIATNLLITTSIRSDSMLRQLSNLSLDDPNLELCQFYMLAKHQDRILTAIAAFEWPRNSESGVLDIQKLLHAHMASTYGCSNYGNPLKVRVTVASTGDIGITSIPVPIVDRISLFPPSLSDLLEPPYAGVPPSFRIFLSPIQTTPDQFTAHKTTQRGLYDDIRAFLPPCSSSTSDESLPAEILLANHAGEVMEGSITTPYFNRGGKWITPAAICGGNLGTTRRYALESGLCTEGTVMKTSVHVNEKVVLSNGVRGFGWGIVEELPVQLNPSNVGSNH